MNRVHLESQLQELEAAKKEADETVRRMADRLNSRTGKEDKNGLQYKALKSAAYVRTLLHFHANTAINSIRKTLAQLDDKEPTFGLFVVQKDDER